MFGVIRTAASKAASRRAFSTSSIRSADLCKLTLIGNLIRDPEVRQSKNDKEYVVYTVATRNYPPPPPDANGERRPSTSSFHRVFSFQDYSSNFLRTLKKGTKLYVEAAFELREPEPGADASSPQGQRQIFLRHEMVRVITYPQEDATHVEERVD